MKTLFLVRHAKSSWENPDVKDHERPLLQKGIKRTEKIAEFLKRRKLTPGIIVSSHAVRANETAGLIAKHLSYPEEDIIIDEKLYLSGVNSIMNVIYALPEEKDSAMIVGHNPCMTQLVNLFLETKIETLPTTGLVCVAFDTKTWSDVPLAESKVKFVVFPKDL